MNPNSSRALRLLASALMFEKQPAKALSRVQEQIAKSPQNAEMYDLLADLQMATGDPKSALASSEKAMQLNPNDSAAVIAYTRAEVAAGDPAKAVAKWQQWTTAHPTDVQGFTLLAPCRSRRATATAPWQATKKHSLFSPSSQSPPTIWRT